MDLGDLACVGDKDPGLDSFLCHWIEADRIDGIPFLGKGEIAALVGSADSGSVDGFAVGLHPQCRPDRCPARWLCIPSRHQTRGYPVFRNSGRAPEPGFW